MKNLLDKIDAQGGIGTHGEYLYDYMITTKLTRLAYLPNAVAEAWVKIANVKNICVINKSWVVVDTDYNGYLILYNLDGKIILYCLDY